MWIQLSNTCLPTLPHPSDGRYMSCSEIWSGSFWMRWLRGGRVETKREYDIGNL